MSRRICALAIIALFLFGTVTAAIPVHATFTLGDLTGTYRYHANDFDPHVPGVIGYVWPGGGQNAYSGFPNFANINNAPGYQSPYPRRKPGLTAGTSGNAPSKSWYQLEGDAYAPFGAVLAGSTGDLIFAINATCSGSAFCSWGRGWSGIAILLPPPFTLSTMDGSNVVSTLTNDYAKVYVTRLSPYDRY